MSSINKRDDHIFAIPKRKSAMGAVAAPKVSKQHKRSRSGCFTCRLRRKKCDELRPSCKACKHLGLRCDYRRPMWWGSADARRKEKERIKDLIKDTQTTRKTAKKTVSSISSSTPPELSRTISTPPDSRCTSVDQSPRFSEPHSHKDPYHPIYLPPRTTNDIDVRTEKHVFVNDTSIRRNSTVSTFSTIDLQSYKPMTWPGNDLLPCEFFDVPPNEEWSFDFVDDFSDNAIQVDPQDKALLDHFIQSIVGLVFPVLDVTQGEAVKRDYIQQALNSNPGYLHCCLSAAATDGDFDHETTVMHHRCATITELCKAFEADIDHEGILETTLALIFYPTIIGRLDDNLPDISWRSHLDAARSLANKLGMPNALLHSPPSLNMSLIAWTDVLGATMQGRCPLFADTYRTLHMSQLPAGLDQLMGCDDSVMYVISEIACLEERRHEGLDEFTMCTFVETLGHAISRTELLQSDDPLVASMTTLFRLAARVYLCSLIPGATIHDANMLDLIVRFEAAWMDIEPGPQGFDRSLVWPLLMAGAHSTRGSTFRRTFAQRMILLGHMGEMGSVVRLKEILTGLWAVNDRAAPGVVLSGLHWRDVMAQKGWDCLLI